MGIDLRNVDGAVPEHLLDVTYIHVGLQQAGGKGMAEHVGGDMELDGSQGRIFVYHSSDGLVRERPPGLIDEKMVAAQHLISENIPVFYQYMDDVIIPNLYSPLL